MASPPPSIQFIIRASINPAVTTKAIPIVILIFRSDSRDTMPAPITAPAVADTNIKIKVSGSTSMMVIKINA